MLEPYFAEKGGKPFTTWVEPIIANIDNVIMGQPVIEEGEEEETKEEIQGKEK